MRLRKGIMTGLLASAFMFGVSFISIEAAGFTAGVTASLGDSITMFAGVCKTAGLFPTLGNAEDEDLPNDNTHVDEDTEDEVIEEVIEEDTTICGYTNLGIAEVENHLNIREGAGLEYSIVGKLPRNAGCEILEYVGDWCKIQSGEVTGFVKTEYLLTGAEAAARAELVKSDVAVINANTVYVRKEPNTECTILDAMPKGEELPVIEILEDWVKVQMGGTEGYVYAQYVDVSEQLPKAMTYSQFIYGIEVSQTRIQLVEFALQYVGNRYVWGGESLTNGVDCSGFTMKVYERFGVSLPHYSGSQAQLGTSITSAEAKPGDLFFYSSAGRIDHVGIYIGNGQIVHAASTKSGIIISSAYHRNPTKIISLID